MKFPIHKKFIFYLSLIYYKLTSCLECQNYKLKILNNEFAFVLSMLGLRKLKDDSSTYLMLKTNHGNMYIRNMDIDLTIASPSFERLDINFLKQLMEISLKNNKEIVYVDVGAGFGNQIIILSNFFKKMNIQPHILAFEPDEDSVKLLKKNIKLNAVKNIQIFEVALSDKKTEREFYFYEPMKQIVSFPTEKKVQVSTNILSNYIKSMNLDLNTDLYIKMDIEGHEKEALIGCHKLKGMCDSITLMIEDSVKMKQKELISYLEQHARFIDKRTVYNSFWNLY